MNNAVWIWYPGDFEIYHGMRQNFRREERGLGWPAFWKMDDWRRNVRFFRRYELTQPETFTIFGCGVGHVQADGRKYPLGKPVTLPAGEHLIEVFIGNITGLPCIYVESNTEKNNGEYTSDGNIPGDITDESIPGDITNGSISCDIANGTGVRITLFVSGCRNRCEGCFQPETWNFRNGTIFSERIEEELLDSLAPDYIRGLTLLGGDPFEEENQKAKALLATREILFILQKQGYELLQDPRVFELGKAFHFSNNHIWNNYFYNLLILF